MKISDIEFKQHSHMSFEHSYLNTEVGEYNGKKIYKHTHIRKTDFGYGVGKSKVTYSETLKSKDIGETEILEILQNAVNNLTKKKNER